MTLTEMQNWQPWLVPYSPEFEVVSIKLLPYIHGTHVVLHAAKSVGKLASVFEAADHRNATGLTLMEQDTIQAMAADLVTAALRLANLYGFNLERVLCERVKEKNGVGFGESK